VTSTIEWFNGYAFWRAQYTSRNEQYKSKKALLNGLSSEFLRTGLNHHPSFEIGKLRLEWSAGVGKPMPPTQEEWPFTIDMLRIVIAYRNIDHEIRSEFPYAEPFLADVHDIIESLCNNTFPPISAFTVDNLNLYPSEIVFGRCSRAVELVHKNKSTLLVKIDFSQETPLILDRVRLIVEQARLQPDTGEKREQFLEFVQAWKGEEAAAQASASDYIPPLEPDLDPQLLKRRKRESVGKYRPGTDTDKTRAIGLWLYDYMIENQVKPVGAVRALRQEEFYEFFGKKNPDDEIFMGIIRKTKACIDQAEVLAMT
jgi:hypothetical protein